MTDEYIRKEDVLKEKRTGTFPNGICLEAKACVTVEYIKSIQPADVVKVVHGEWEDKEVIHKRCIEEWQSARCSACGKYHTTPYMYYFDDFKFCPNCGARMDGGKKHG